MKEAATAFRVNVSRSSGEKPRVEAIAYFRANYPRVPVIVLTGFPDTDMATSMLRQGVVDYLVKPVEGEKLRESIARAMEQRELAHLQG